MIIFVTASADTYITNRKTQYVDAKTSNVGRAATLDFFKLYNENKLINSQGQIILTGTPAPGDTITLEDADSNQVVFEFVDEDYDANTIGENIAGSNHIAVPLDDGGVDVDKSTLSSHLKNAINNVTTKVQDGPDGNLTLGVTATQNLNKILVTQSLTGEKGDKTITKSGDNITVYGFSRIEESKALIKFDLNNLQGTYFNLDHSNIANSFTASLVLKDVTSGHTKPRNMKFSAIPLKNEFIEGLGRDTSGFTDGDISNYLTSSKDSSTGKFNTWKLEGLKSEGTISEDGDVFTQYTVNGVDKDASGSSEVLVQGDEDLTIDITNFVSGAIRSDSPIDNNGLLLKVHDDIYNDANSYFVKRFGSRHLLNKTLVPRVEISFNDSVFLEENTEELYFNTQHELCYYHSVNGVLSDIVLSDPADVLKLKFKNDTYDFTSGEVVFAKKKDKLNNDVSGKYKATVLNTLVSQFDTNLISHVQASGSLNLTGSWYIDRAEAEAEDFILKNIVYKFSVSDEEYSNIKNLRTKIILENEPFNADNTIQRARVYFIDTLKSYKPYKVPYALKSLKFSNVRYDLIDVDTNKTLIKGSDTITKLVYNNDSYMFDIFVPDIFKHRRVKFKFFADGKTIDTEQIFRLQ